MRIRRTIIMPAILALSYGRAQLWLALRYSRRHRRPAAHVVVASPNTFHYG